MAVVKVSSQEMKKGMPLEAKWYSGVIKEMKIEPTKDKSGINNNLIVVIEDGSVEGRELKEKIFDSNMKPLWEAALSTEETPFTINPDEDYNFDTDDIAGKRINVRVENDIYQGRPIPKMKTFIAGHIDTSTIPW